MMPADPDARKLAGAEEVRLGRETALPRSGALSSTAALPASAYRWYHKAGAMVLAVFCMGIGIFLLAYPWTESWNRNYFAALIPEWHQYWGNLYLRGAVSGLGVVNFYISLAEALRLRRFARD
jgi:hypothetical protein